MATIKRERHPNNSLGDLRNRCFRVVALVLTGIVLVHATAGRSRGAGKPVSATWQRIVLDIAWVDYAPTVSDPAHAIPPTKESIRADLRALRQVGFTGLVTYACGGLFGREVVAAAADLGFRGVIIGVWDPTSELELTSAIQLGQEDVVIGFCVGNEGYRRRYPPQVLEDAMDRVRSATGKPVTTTEEIGDYEAFEELVGLGDWVFPNAHPFFNGRRTPAAAVRWTRGAFDDFSSKWDRFIWFKEVGLPTGGAEPDILTESSQVEYYRELAGSPVQFAYFEAFDQAWKDWRPFEQRWGMFRADRTPKLLAKMLAKDGPRVLRGVAPKKRPSGDATSMPEEKEKPPFVVYSDGGVAENHFSPSGVDGDCGDVRVYEHWRDRPFTGETCMRIEYRAEGAGPNDCSYDPPCKWSALRWLHPRQNRGTEAVFQGRGFDLSGFHTLTFWVRAERPCRLKFLVGGVDEAYGDSVTYPRSKTVRIGTTWEKVVIDLADADLSHIISGFGWETNWETNPDGAVFFLDQIQFE